jgi:Ca2+/Na+ antiporter
MASTVEPIAITATETFISFYATFLGVTDVGISAFLGSNAFTACVERGIMILFAGAHGEIDWYVSLRDMITYAICLLAIGLLISNGTITTTNTMLMLAIFFVYWVFMQYNSVIENYARKSLRLRKLYKVLPRCKDEEIATKHRIERRELEYLPEYYIDSDYVVKDGWLQMNSLGTVCNFGGE